MTKQYFTKDEVVALARKCGYGKTITSKKLREFDLESRADELHALCEMAAQVAIGKPVAEDKAGGDEPVEFWNAVDGWVSVPAERADKPAAWVYPEFWEHLEKVGCGTAYRTDGDGRQPLFTRPQPQADVPEVGFGNMKGDKK